MPSKTMQQALQLIETEVQSRPTAFEFELAYQARVAMDRIRFAIKHTEHFGPPTDEMREAGFQLLDALHRLETADRKFQERSRGVSKPPQAATELSPEVSNGHQWKSSDARAATDSTGKARE